MINRASEILDVKLDEFQEFTERDSFSNNILCGVICKRSDYRYGSMVIFEINEEPTEQVIYGTPKLNYPFDRGGHFHWPKIVQLEA